ncbi:ankyrin repeat domain-containing protein [Parapedobacter sp. 10938]|uniref:ankyrin repeat domain-containing protein n=1 Tax=Parapedobacter flavus TaxID=3110225 RepID=UPI002DB64A8B|nr:ankyrin repeat domain-containing protein [Parapedobacter sp. 10938]MEC3880285.1 ankyrin repeat domain-containing protein [Parapedobacter sp. 10938]
MKPFKTSIKKLLEQKDYQSLRKQLFENPNLSNEGITIPYDFFCRTKAHPLHRICDAVFAGKITDEEAIQFAKIFLEFGANIDGDKKKDEGTPILAASSLHAEKLGIFYIENGADIHYTHKNNGASALHWASYCGRDKLAKRLIEVGAEIDKADRNYNSTPLGWAIHSLQTRDVGNNHNQIGCIKLLLKNGADVKRLDSVKKDYLFSLGNDDSKLQNLLNQ